MSKWALGIEYNGANYHGFQSQPNLPTVQGALEDALSKVADEPIRVICAGRTDRGVHAHGQVIHFDTQVERESVAWHRGGNASLPDDIAITWVKCVPKHFHARFSARSRRYRYLIYNHHTRPAILKDVMTWISYPLSVALMHEGAQHLLGEHDFSALRGAGCQSKTPIRTIEKIEVTQHGLVLCVDITANAFLLHMVRNIVGTLCRVGREQETPAWVAEVLASRDRSQAGMTSKPNGLSLIEVEYPLEFKLPIGHDVASKVSLELL